MTKAAAQQESAKQEEEQASPERKQYAPGWYKNLSNEEYHGSAGFSSSQVKMMIEKTPAHLKANIDDPGAEMTSDSMMLGTIVHTKVLEPEQFDKEYYVDEGGGPTRPTGIAGEIADALVSHGEEALAVFRTVPEDINRRTAEGKARYAEFEKTCKKNKLVIVKTEHIEKARQYWEVQRKGDGRIIISKQQNEQATAMADNVLNHSRAKMLLQDGISESSVYWWYNKPNPDDDVDYRMMMKCRPDRLPISHDCIVDLKTAVDATITGFQRAIMRYYYHVSAAMYLEGVNQNKELLEEMKKWSYSKFVFIIVENKPPYLPRVLELSAKDIELGRRLYHRSVRMLQQGINDDWPGYPERIEVIELPTWAERIHIV